MLGSEASDVLEDSKDFRKVFKERLFLDEVWQKRKQEYRKKNL